MAATRSKARKVAVDILYAAELRHCAAADLLAEGIEQGTVADREYTTRLVDGVVSNRAAIDETLATYLAVDWPLERMPAVDRAIARVATFELMYCQDVPTGVAISEAVDLATSLSTDRSPAFINGLLAEIADAHPRA